MNQTAPMIRHAAIDDADLMAELVNYAGEGFPVYLWAQLAEPHETAWDVGRRRAAREDGGFSYRNASMIESDGKPVGCLIGYEIPDEPQDIGDDMPPMFVPLQELENIAAGTWYVNVLAVLPEYRGRGLGRSLLSHAEALSRSLNKRGLSVIVSDANLGARRLYESCEYCEIATRPMVKEAWANEGQHWVLMTKMF